METMNFSQILNEKIFEKIYPACKELSEKKKYMHQSFALSKKQIDIGITKGFITC